LTLEPAAHDPYQALRYPEYRWLLTGTLTMMSGFFLQSLVMGWQVYELTHDPLSLGMIGLAEALPCLALTLFGGWAADRWDRRHLSVAATSLLLGGAVLLLLLSFRPQLRSAWPFYAIQALAGVGRAFFRPATQSLGTDLVPREVYQNAATWRSSIQHLSRAVGPALGGLLLAFGSGRLAYSVEVLLMAISVFAWTRIHTSIPQPELATPIWRSLSEGIAFIAGKRLLLSAITLDLFAVMFGGAVAMLPAFASEVLRSGPQGLGVLRAAPALGSVLMAIGLAHHGALQRAGGVLLASIAAFGLCWIGFALSTSFGLSLLLLLAGGAFDNISSVLRATLIQTLTPRELMGRAQSVNGLFIASSNELGAFESGLAARLVGLVPSVVLGGCVTLLVVAVTAWRVPELRRLRRVQGN
jgi:MFS family permease